MAKVVCDSCGTTFKYEVVKDMKNCPVCGELLWDEEGESEGNTSVRADIQESDEGLMYFDGIETTYKECPEYNCVCVYCGECKEFNDLELDNFEKLVDKEYVILKKDVVLKCEGCGKEHKPRKILYKKKDHDTPSLPRCPVCNSAMLKIINTG